MKVGVISDTHGMLERTRMGIALFEREPVEAIFHCGDVGGLDVLRLFAGKRLWFVWGNTDHAAPSWRWDLDAWGLPWPEDGPLRIDLGGKRIVVAHGHEPDFRRIVRDPRADFLFYGHSHVRALARVDDCTVVNPGAIQRTSQPTVSVVDLATGQVRHMDLQGRPASSSDAPG